MSIALMMLMVTTGAANDIQAEETNVRSNQAFPIGLESEITYARATKDGLILSEDKNSIKIIHCEPAKLANKEYEYKI